MSTVRFPMAEAPGIIRDIDAIGLPPGVWSDGNNVLFRDRKISKAFGFANYIASPTISARGLFFCPLNTQGLWVYPGLTAVRAFDVDGATADITRAAGAYTGGEENRWNFAFLHGLGIVNNGIDAPQLWSPPGTSQLLVDLTNWPAATSTRVMRPFLAYLIALDVTKAGTRYSMMVKWGDQADPGAVPGSWDETDPTVDAGEALLSDTPGVIIDGAALGAGFYVYKEDAVYSMVYVGGQFIFNFQHLPFSFGVIAQNSIVEFKSSHFVPTYDDIVVHNGNSVKSILDRRNRNWLNSNLERASADKCFSFHYTSRSEIWFAFPSLGSGVPNTFLIYNYAQDSITFRAFPNCHGVSYAPPMKISQGDTWDADTTTTWAGDANVWDEPSFTTLKERVLFINRDDGTIDEMDQTVFTENTVSVRSYIERQSMPFAGVDKDGNVVIDFDAMKFVMEIWPQITGTSGAEVLVYFGTQMDPEDAVTWASAVTFTIGTTKNIPVYLSCRLFSVRFEATGSDLWEIQGFSYEVSAGGRF